MRVRVFLSSPGDVAEERAAARRIIHDLQYDPLLRGKVLLEAVSWDDPLGPAPMVATLTPQEAVNRGLPQPADCDIVVVIFWSRMGTPLPASAAAGTEYLSGTHYEFEEARRAKRPVLLYRRSERPSLSIDDPELDEKRQQWRLVGDFFARFVAPDGSISTAYTTYASPAEFCARLEVDLRSELKRLLDTEPASGAAPIPRMVTPERLLTCLARLGLDEPETTGAIAWMEEELQRRSSSDNWSDRSAREEALRRTSRNPALKNAIDFLRAYIECVAPAELVGGSFYVSATKIGQMYRSYRLGASTHEPQPTVEDKFHRLHEHLAGRNRIAFLPATLVLGEPLSSAGDSLVYFTSQFVLMIDDELLTRFPSARRALESGSRQDRYGLVSEIFQCPDPMTYSLVEFTATIGKRPVRMVLSRKHIAMGSMTATSLSNAITRRPVGIAGFGMLQTIGGELEIAPLMCRFADVLFDAPLHGPEASTS